MSQNTLRSVVQRLESLQRAGVTHVKKVRKVALLPPAEDAAGKKASVPRPAAPARPTRVVPLWLPWPGRWPLAPVAPSWLGRGPKRFSAWETLTPGLVFCGEAPGADEDRLGEPFVGRAGQLLNDIISKGMKMRRQDVYILNILRCRPPGNRAPLPVEAAACREYLDRQLEIIQPEFICCLGAVAAQNLLGTDATIGRLRGRVHDYHGIKVVCTYHPAYVLRNPQAKRPVWDDIQMLLEEMAKAESGERKAES